MKALVSLQLHHRARRLLPDAVRAQLQPEAGLPLPGGPLAGVLQPLRRADQHGDAALLLHRVRHVHPEGEADVRRLEGQPESQRAQQRAAGRAADHGAEHRRRAAAGGRAFRQDA